MAKMLINMHAFYLKVILMFLRFSCFIALAGGAMVAHAGIAKVAGDVIPPNRVQPQWVESTLCSVVMRAPIDAGKPLQAGNPIDTLVSQPVVCTGNATQQMPMAGGLRLMLSNGFRITSISHQITPIKFDPDGKTELLITALFGLERIVVNGAIGR